MEDLAGVFRVDGLVDGAVGAFIIAGEMGGGVTVVTHFLIVRQTEPTRVAGGSSVAIGGVMEVTKFTPGAVPAHDLVVTGGQATFAV